MSQITLRKVLAATALSASVLANTNANGWTYVNSFLRIAPVSLIFWVVYKFILYPNLFSPLRCIPTVDGDKWWSPQSLELHRSNKIRGDVQSQWIDTIPHEDGLIRYRTITNEERLIVASPESLREVLVTKAYHFEKPELLKIGLKRFAGVGIIVAEGDEHKAQRKCLLPAFEFRHIKDMYSVMWDISAHAVNSLTHDVSATKASTIDIDEWTSSITLSIIYVAGLGLNIDSVLNEGEIYTKLRQVYKMVFKQEKADVIMLFLRVYLPSWALPYVPLKRNRVLGKASQDLRDECRKLVRQRKLELENGITDDTEKNILTVALSDKNIGFTDENLVDQLCTFLAAGHETTATALTWTVYILSIRPDIQNKLREEIRANLPSPSSSAPSAQKLSTIIDKYMPYLNAVVQEVLRFFAPVPATFREAVVDTTIQGYKIPKGTQLILCPRGTNRDKALWGEDSKEFNPDRFLLSQERYRQEEELKRDPLHEDEADVDEKIASPNHSSKRSNFANMTFLHGPRSCIGQSFSRAELAIITATLVGRFELSLVDESQADFSSIPLRRGATFRPLNGLNVKVKMVDGW
ncbi:cytochrome P450 4A12A [Xylariaceae sp. FL0255]|nr:cytochrome P450 4A12A [Xylariaceae sp. FL0255]